jgi:cellulose synthase/poly-beta-1,6-N-acetylglucosamine synthase-like glycosyltransferase
MGNSAQPADQEATIAVDCAAEDLARNAPEMSAKRVVTPPQIVAIYVGLALLGLGIYWAPELVRTGAHAFAFGLFAAMIALRLFAAAVRLSPAPKNSAPPQRADDELPVYTVLCPLYREGSSVAGLVRALEALAYPTAKLDIKLVLEADDPETATALSRLQLGPAFTIVLVPPGAPRTKPKALNFALASARGEFVVVYDAEDVPAPDQLRTALAAFDADPELVCVQAPLLIDNARSSWLAGQFAVEYAIQFLQILPALARMRLPLPLGGTSNHFKTAALREVGAWDPYNVTEDADLGFRLARHGGQIGMILSPTWEEAPAHFRPWLKQRTRWLKGHMQTVLVLMRNPLRTFRELGAAGFLAMHLTMSGAIAAALIHGPLLLALLWSLPAPDKHLPMGDLALAGLGYLSAVLGGASAALSLFNAAFARSVLTMPLYWPLTSLAAILALIELARRPHFWAKTEHGLSAREGRHTRPNL